jgi:cytochrome c oxidase cbb3-type subunit III
VRWMALGCVLACWGCEREDRPFSRVSPERSSVPTASKERAEASGAGHVVRNAFSVSEGQRLFDWFNCSGCHGGRGGGHIGPALTDAEWRYGASVEEVEVYRSIAEGRPQGMPAFRTLVTDAQLWQLSAYVLSLSGRVPQDVGAGRPDGISMGEPPAMHTEEAPKAEKVRL